VNFQALSKEQFQNEFHEKRPVIFTDVSGVYAVQSITSFLQLVSRKNLLNKFGNTTIETLRTGLKDGKGGGFDADPTAVGHGATYTLREYIESMDHVWSADKGPLRRTDYLLGTWGRVDGEEDQQVEIHSKAPFLAKGFMDCSPATQPALLSMGGTGSGTGWHRHGPAWSNQYYGVKRWFLRPPHILEALPRTHTRRRKTTIEWFSDSDDSGYRTLKALEAGLPLENRTLLECVQVPGETIYLPSMWWHTTLNIAQSVSVGLNCQ
jgi:hypothetical protein